MLNEILLQAKRLGFTYVVVGHNQKDMPAVVLTKFTPRKTQIPPLYFERAKDLMELHLGQDKLLDVIRELKFPSIHKIDDLVSGEMDSDFTVTIVHKPNKLKAKECQERVPILTLNGLIWTNPGDYIIEGVNGERYPCDPDIFKKLYDVEE